MALAGGIPALRGSEDSIKPHQKSRGWAWMKVRARMAERWTTLNCGDGCAQGGGLLTPPSGDGGPFGVAEAHGHADAGSING
jgi:hypothetical protein